MLGRRDFLVAVGLGQAICLTGLSPARAQALAASVQQLKNDIPAIFAPGAHAEANAEFQRDFLAQELPARRRFFEELGGASEADLRQQIVLVQDDFNVELSSEDILSFKLPIDAVVQIISLEEVIPVEGETIVDVLLDIAVQVIGLEIVADILPELYNRNDAFRSLVDNLGHSLRIYDTRGGIEEYFEYCAMASWGTRNQRASGSCHQHADGI